MARIRKRTWTNRDGKKGQCWQIDYIDNTGKRNIRGGFKNKAEAECELVKTLNSIEQGTYVNKDKDITFNEAAELYISLHASLHCKKSTYYNYKGYLRNHLKDSLGKKKLNDIKSLDIQRFMHSKVTEGLSNQTVNHIIKFVGAVFQKMVNDEVIFRNPVSKIKKLRSNHKKFEITRLKKFLYK